MVDCCLLFILSSLCMRCLLCVYVVFFVGNKVEFQFIVPGAVLLSKKIWHRHFTWHKSWHVFLHHKSKLVFVFVPLLNCGRHHRTTFINHTVSLLSFILLISSSVIFTLNFSLSLSCSIFDRCHVWYFLKWFVSSKISVQSNLLAMTNLFHCDELLLLWEDQLDVLII